MAKENEMVKAENQQEPIEAKVESLIRVIRGKQVMLDRDLAGLYGVETKYLNRQVKRNIERFPDDFMFQLTKEECLRCQIGTLNEGRGKHLKLHALRFYRAGSSHAQQCLAF